MFYNIQYNTPPHTYIHARYRVYIWGFPGGSAAKNMTAMQQATCNPSLRDAGSIPVSGRSPGEANGLTITVFLPGKSHGQRSPAGYSLWGHKVGHNLATKPPPPDYMHTLYMYAHIYLHICVFVHIYIQRERDSERERQKEHICKTKIEHLNIKVAYID